MKNLLLLIPRIIQFCQQSNMDLQWKIKMWLKLFPDNKCPWSLLKTSFLIMSGFFPQTSCALTPFSFFHVSTHFYRSIQSWMSEKKLQLGRLELFWKLCTQELPQCSWDSNNSVVPVWVKTISPQLGDQSWFVFSLHSFWFFWVTFRSFWRGVHSS